MKKTEQNLTYLYMLFSACFVVASCISSKSFATGIMLFGAPVNFTIGTVVSGITFLITDIIGELWGKKEANIAVTGGLICQIVCTAIIALCRYIPSSSVAMQEAYVMLLGQGWLFVLAGLASYLSGQYVDVAVFHAIRDKYIKKHGSTKGGKWIWNNVGTLTSQLIGSTAFVLVAFGLGQGWLFAPTMFIEMFNMILGMWVFKALIALVDTPFFYLLTRNSEQK